MSKQKHTLTVYNGNGQPITKHPPHIFILDKMNDTAFAHLKHNTGLKFRKSGNSFIPYFTQADNFEQIAKLFFTYDFKTKYYDNYDFHNTLMLKFMNDSKDWD